MLNATIDRMRLAVSRFSQLLLPAACANEAHDDRMPAGRVGRPLDDLMM